ncbi:hypothetical protein PS850_06156 [Pseudomonas fluorescens]|nr:hypothetical protein PS850_06156 [Pseudomonas fluorescens]
MPGSNCAGADGRSRNPVSSIAARFVGLLGELSEVADGLDAHRSKRSELVNSYVVQGGDRPTDSFSGVLPNEFLLD